jgi:signal transduction histidine kinase
MKHLSDKELISELRSRFEQNHKLMKELKELNKKLEESEVLKSQFLSNIRNEINNPFAAILGLSQNILSMEKDDFERSRQTAAMIFNEAFKLDYQLRNIFAAAEVEAGELFPEVHEVNIHRLVQDVTERFSYKATEKRVRLKSSFDVENNARGHQSFLLLTDSGMLELIVSNLLSNAIKFSSPESVVYISTIRKNDGISIAVRDHGLGISPVNQETIFDRFFQLDQGSAKQFQGQGLGLSVAKALAEILNGTIQVVSQENAGSVFTLNLPEQSRPLEGEDFSINEDGIFL